MFVLVYRWCRGIFLARWKVLPTHQTGVVYSMLNAESSVFLLFYNFFSQKLKEIMENMKIPRDYSEVKQY